MKQDLPFRTTREALRVLRRAVKVDIAEDGRVTPETEAMGRLIFREYIAGKPAPRHRVRRSQQRAFGRKGRAMRFESEAI